MVSLRDSLLSSSARKLPIRMRPDLSARRHHYLGRTYWIVKDPIGLNYYRFQQEEYAILQMLDGNTSMDELKERFEAEYPPQKITLDELQQFLGMLHRSGLVIAAVGGQGQQLLKRRKERRRKELLNAVANILCIRFKGFDPERFLAWLYPKVRWFFTPAAVTLSLLLMLSAVTLITVKFSTVQEHLPAFKDFFNLSNALWLSVTLGVIKIIHEFGHGLTCKHFGGECHEMGVMVLVLTPCLYCNVSDSWMLPNKWHRAAIGAGGMYFELVLAAAATWLWWFTCTQPGLLNHLCLNAMFVASVTTVIFNANPLLRYDGYYILADVTEIPNLRQKATTILSRKLGEWMLGLEPAEDPFLPERNQIFFVIYSIAATIYRWVVLFSILLFLYHFLKPYGLQKIGQMIALASLWGLIGMPLYQVGKFLHVPGRLEKVKKPRMYTSMALVAGVLAAVAFVPLPHSVMATMEVQPHGADSVYVNVPEGGRLAEVLVVAGQQVEAGQVLARLESSDLELEISKLQAKIDQCKVQLENLSRLGQTDPKATSEKPQIEEAKKAAIEQLADKEKDCDRLVLKAGRRGVVLPPPISPPPKSRDTEEQLASWEGTPLDRENLGAYLREGVLFCQVGDPRKLEAILIVDQADIDFIREGQKADLKFDELPCDTLHGRIDCISLSNLKIVPQRLGTKAGGDLPVKTDPGTGQERPQSTSYQARVPLEDTEGVLRLGLRGRAKIHTDPMSLGGRLWRLAVHTFNFKL
ncbi:MAG: biotin/lipoyl-binding protein [Thermoguttaceae bacterium]